MVLVTIKGTHFPLFPFKNSSHSSSIHYSSLDFKNPSHYSSIHYSSPDPSAFKDRFHTALTEPEVDVHLGGVALQEKLLYYGRMKF